MELEQALRSTGAVREFSDQPVADAVVHHILDTARFAPSGGNRQAWRVVLVKDRAVRVRLRELYLGVWKKYLALGAAGLVPWAPIGDRNAELDALARAPGLETLAGGLGDFAERFEDVPVLLVLLADLRGLAAVDRDLDRYTFVGGASIYPFAWSVLLAAHDAGLGGVITSMVVQEEQTVCELLGVPAGWAVAAMVVLGYPAGRRPTRLRRRAVEDFATVDRFDGPSLGG